MLLPSRQRCNGKTSHHGIHNEILQVAVQLQELDCLLPENRLQRRSGQSRVCSHSPLWFSEDMRMNPLIDIVYSQPADTGTGNNVNTQLVYAVNHLKVNPFFETYEFFFYICIDSRRKILCDFKI